MDNIQYKYYINLAIGALVLWGISYSTISSNVPRIYSPYSFSVVIPTFMLYSVLGSSTITTITSTLLIPVLYILWCFHLLRDCKAIPKRSLVCSSILIFLSAYQLTVSWTYGIKYQGMVHTIVMYIFNIIFWIALFIMFRANRKKPSYATNYMFHWIFFAWFCWVAFPWLGELL